MVKSTAHLQPSTSASLTVSTLPTTTCMELESNWANTRSPMCALPLPMLECMQQLNERSPRQSPCPCSCPRRSHPLHSPCLCRSPHTHTHTSIISNPLRPLCLSRCIPPILSTIPTLRGPLWLPHIIPGSLFRLTPTICSLGNMFGQ
jgi:hypothetical protein